MANDKKAVVAIAKEPTVQESVTKVFDLSWRRYKHD